MLSSGHVAFYSTDAILVRLLWFARDFFSVLQSLLEGKRWPYRHRGRVDLGDLAAGWHGRAAILGATGRPYGQARPIARASDPRDSGRLLWRLDRERLLGDCYSDGSFSIGWHRSPSDDDVGESGLTSRRGAARLRSGAGLGHDRLFRSGAHFPVPSRMGSSAS